MSVSSLTDQFVEFGPGRRVHALVGPPPPGTPGTPGTPGSFLETSVLGLPGNLSSNNHQALGSSSEVSDNQPKTFGSESETSGGGGVVFFPGNGGSAADFGPVMEQLTSRFGVVGLDFPGRSETQWPDVRFDFTSDLHPVIDWSLSQLGVGIHFVVGHGSGGMAALQHAKRHHGQVQGIILLESYLNAEIQNQTISRKHRRPIRFESQEQIAFQRRRMRHSLWLNEHATFRESFISSQKGYNAAPWINELDIPIQVQVADSGQPLPPEKDLLAWKNQLGMTEIKNLEITKVPDSGHWLMLDDPNYVAQKIDGFIKKTQVSGL